MSIQKTEYAKHTEIYEHTRNLLTESDYNKHLENLRTQIGGLIQRPGIGAIIFNYLKDDIASAVAFTRISKVNYEHARKEWFVSSPRAIILKYIQKETSYRYFLKSEGWQNMLILALKVGGVALTITAGVKAANHESRIPKDAPKKTTTYIDDYGDEIEITYIDHPEARLADAWRGTAIVVGTCTAVGIVSHGLMTLLEDIDLDLFFSNIQRDFITDVEPSLGLKILSLDSYEWKLTKMKENLTSNPTNWKTHPELMNMICPISGDFMLFPVKDKCGHYFDYRSVRGYQLSPAAHNPHECPVSSIKPNRGLAQLEFDKARFDKIQRIIRSEEKV